MSDLELLKQQIETLFLHDDGRLLCVNEPDKPAAPRFFLGRTLQGNVWRFRRNLPEEVVRALGALARLEPVSERLEAEPVYLRAFQNVLHEHGAVQQVWSGPAYRFPKSFRSAQHLGVVQVTDANANVLSDFPYQETMLEAVQPCVALLQGGQAVSVCCSARTSAGAAEASLETLGAFRGRGYAAAVVTSWAAAVRAAGRTPLYSTSWDNPGSQGVAKKLGLKMYASDLH